MLNIIVFEDNEHEFQVLHKCLVEFFSRKSIEYKIDFRNTFPSDISDMLYYDIMFIDIELNEQSGIEFGYKLRQKYPDILIIITSSHPQYLIDGYKIDAKRYILKPIDKQLFDIEMEDVLSSSFFKQHFGFYDSNIAPYKIHYSEIMYVEFLDRKTHVHLLNGNILICTYTLKQWSTILNNKGFAQSHKSFIVNLYHISGFASDDKEIILSNDEKIPLSRHFKKVFQEDYYSHIHTLL